MRQIRLTPLLFGFASGIWLAISFHSEPSPNWFILFTAVVNLLVGYLYTRIV